MAVCTRRHCGYYVARSNWRGSPTPPERHGNGAVPAGRVSRPSSMVAPIGRGGNGKSEGNRVGGKCPTPPIPANGSIWRVWNEHTAIRWIPAFGAVDLAPGYACRCSGAFAQDPGVIPAHAGIQLDSTVCVIAFLDPPLHGDDDTRFALRRGCCTFRGRHAARYAVFRRFFSRERTQRTQNNGFPPCALCVLLRLKLISDESPLGVPPFLTRCVTY